MHERECEGAAPLTHGADEAEASRENSIIRHCHITKRGAGGQQMNGLTIGRKSRQRSERNGCSGCTLRHRQTERRCAALQAREQEGLVHHHAIRPPGSEVAVSAVPLSLVHTSRPNFSFAVCPHVFARQRRRQGVMRPCRRARQKTRKAVFSFAISVFCVGPVTRCGPSPDFPLGRAMDVGCAQRRGHL